MSADPQFLLDRSVGGKHLANALRSLDFTVHTLASVYGEEKAQALEDEVWLADAGENDWVVLMADKAIRRRPAERDALSAAGVRAFCVTTGQLRKEAQTARFIDNLDHIIQQCATKGPYIFGVYESSIKRLWPD